MLKNIKLINNLNFKNSLIRLTINKENNFNKI